MPLYTCFDPTNAEGDDVLDVRFKITNRGFGPDATDPGSPPEIDLISAIDENGFHVLARLTPEQHQALEAEILADFTFDQHLRDEHDAALEARAEARAEQWS